MALASQAIPILADIVLGGNVLAMTNALAYYSEKLIAAVKSFVESAH
jgi:hypothetical protein